MLLCPLDGDSQAAIDSLAPGDSLSWGWRQLDGGGRYRGVIRRTDAGGQPLYLLKVDGRGPGLAGGRKTLTLALTAGPGTGYKLGECCEGTVTMRGDARVADLSPALDGRDEHPAAWDSAGVC